MPHNKATIHLQKARGWLVCRQQGDIWIKVDAVLVEDDFQKYTNDLSFGVRLYRRAGEHGLRIPRSSFITRSKK